MHIKVLNNTQTEVIDAAHQFVTVGPNCWGTGDTIKVALKNCMRNAPSGPSKAGRLTFITKVVPRDGFEVNPVDGSLAWSAKHDAKNCPICTVGKGISVFVD